MKVIYKPTWFKDEVVRDCGVLTKSSVVFALGLDEPDIEYYKFIND